MAIFYVDFSYYEKLGNNSLCIDDDIPFEIPDSWSWCKLLNIGQSELGKTLNGDKPIGKKAPYLCSINVYWDGIILDNVKTTYFSDSEQDKYKLIKRDLLICEGGESGRCAVWNSEQEMYYQNALHRVRFYSDINPYFYKYIIESYHHSGFLEGFCSGVTIKHLVKSSLHSIPLPLPPIQEQLRIVQHVKSLFSLIESIESSLS